MIELSSVSFEYSPGSPWERSALRDVDLTICPGERILVAGSNGSGKTSLAWILAGLLTPTSGTALIDGSPLSKTMGKVGLGFQHARLQLFRPTVAADVRFGTDLGDADLDRVLGLVGLPGPRYRDMRIDALSGGELRRVALAGLLVRRPRLLVLDEPFAGLDSPARSKLVEVITRLQTDTDVATVIVTHDVEDTLPLAHRAVVLEEGSVVYDGTVENAGAKVFPRQVGKDPGSGAPAEPAAPGAKKNARQVGRDPGTRNRPRASLADLHLFRYLPGTSPLQRAHPGPKLLGTLALGVASALVPTWTTVGILAVVVVASVVAARVPAGAVPRIPAWVGIALAISGVIAALAGGEPAGLGGLLDWMRLTLLGILALTFGFLLGWTTRASDLAPSVSRGLAPLRLVGVPVADISTVLGLTIRCLPLLFDEMRTLSAAFRLRRYRVPPGFRERIVFVHDLLVTALTTSVRRASEMSRAMEARGGPSPVRVRRSRMGVPDAVVLAVTVAAVAAMFLL